jgi:hypothetical protein
VLKNAVATFPRTAWGTGEAANFDPGEFVSQRLDPLEKQDQFKATGPWWHNGSGVI